MQRARHFVASHARSRASRVRPPASHAREGALRVRPVATVAIAAVGLATAIWLPTRFDWAQAEETGAPVLEQIFSDDFNGAAGDEADNAKWSTESRAVRLDGEGNLVLGGRNSSLSRRGEIEIQTAKTFSAPAGQVTARVKAADGQSVRSVFRLLDKEQSGLEVMKNSGDRSAVVSGALGETVDGSLETGKSLADDFHDYTVIWSAAGDIIWTFDGQEFLRTKRGPATTLDEPFAASLELSARSSTRRSTRGGDRTDGTSMKVDFVRISVEKEKAEEPAEPTTPPTTEPTTPPSTEPTTPPATQAPAATPWTEFQDLKKGDRVTFNGKTYEVLADHTSLPGWDPLNSPPDLFKEVS